MGTRRGVATVVLLLSLALVGQSQDSFEKKIDRAIARGAANLKKLAKAKKLEKKQALSFSFGGKV